MSVVVYDIETLQGCFTYTDIDVNTKKVSQFVLHSERWDLDAFINHLKTLTHQIGYNNVNFDYPVIHHILTRYFYWGVERHKSFVINSIYNKVQEIVEKQSAIDFLDRTAVKQSDWKIQQLDLFKLWHFNNAAKRQSLKGLEVNMNFPNVMEMSIPHDKQNISLEEVDEILKYNLNDVLATYEFYKISIPKIKLRQQLRDKYKIPCMNYPDSKLGEQLMMKFYCEATESSYFEVKDLRTFRNSIIVKDLLFNYIKFNSGKMNEALKFYQDLVITDTKGKLKKTVIYKGFAYDFGLGGIHGSVKAGVYSSNDEWIIIDADVGSMYPNIAIQNKIYIEHLSSVFCEIYENKIVIPRLQAKKRGDKVIADGFKLAANSVYGKSNDEHSFLFDPLYTMQTTINGQLSLAMLAESVVDNLECMVIQANTDGITFKIKRSDLDRYYELCKNWEIITKLNLEYAEYDKMIIRDVNNYAAITTKGKKKYKGAFRPNDIIIQDEEWHKDFSFNIIQIALDKYFFDGVSIQETIRNHTNIYDFCGRQKFVGKDFGTTHEIVNNDDFSSEKIQKQQKVTRYYVSTKGAVFMKNYEKGTKEKIHVGRLVTIFNEYIDKRIVKIFGTEEGEIDLTEPNEVLQEYNIDYNFYIQEANKIINVVENPQLTLL